MARDLKSKIEFKWKDKLVLSSNFFLLVLIYIRSGKHLPCVKSVLIWSYSGLHFPGFGLNTERILQSSISIIKL